MTAAAVTRPAQGARDIVGLWCGWVMVGAAVLTPLLGWLSPLGFAPLLAVMGLLCLPAVRLIDEDRPALIVLLGLLVFAAVSTTWSPNPAKAGSDAFKLAAGVPLFWSAVCGARRADPRLNALALRVLAFGLAIWGLELMAETATGAAIFRHLHESYYEPIRVDLAQVKMGHSTFVLAVLWPVVLLGGLRQRWEVALLACAVVGTVAAAHVFGSDAPVLAFPLSALAMLAVWLWPRFGPRLIAAKVAALSLLMPGLIWAVRASGDYLNLEHSLPESWAARMSYWSHTIDWIWEHPFRGWGLDASRFMGPGISLHPHNAALQIWLELGVVGAVAAAVFWGLTLIRMGRDEPDQAMAGVAGSTAAFILFAWINFGAWQEWWLALGAFIPVISAMLLNRDPISKST